MIEDHLIDVFKIWNGGIAIYGALIGAIICAIIYFRYRGYNFWRIADICAPRAVDGANDRPLGQLRQSGSLRRTGRGNVFAR
ncbi:prolipoprotein diacylglyceryl transferase family protein [Paenibacillus sp. JTLBN-2024]